MRGNSSPQNAITISAQVATLSSSTIASSMIGRLLALWRPAKAYIEPIYNSWQETAKHFRTRQERNLPQTKWREWPMAVLNESGPDPSGRFGGLVTAY